MKLLISPSPLNEGDSEIREIEVPSEMLALVTDERLAELILLPFIRRAEELLGGDAEIIIEENDDAAAARYAAAIM